MMTHEGPSQIEGTDIVEEDFEDLVEMSTPKLLGLLNRIRLYFQSAEAPQVETWHLSPQDREAIRDMLIYVLWVYVTNLVWRRTRRRISRFRDWIRRHPRNKSLKPDTLNSNMSPDHPPEI